MATLIASRETQRNAEVRWRWRTEVRRYKGNPKQYRSDSQNQELPGSVKLNRPLHNQHLDLLLGAEGVHYVNAGGAGCWQYAGYYCGG